MWAQLRVGHLLGQRSGARHDHGRPAFGVRILEQRVEGGYAQTHQVRRRHEVRLVRHPSRRVEAHGPGREELLEVGGEIARRAVVARHHERRALGLGVEE